MAKIKFNGNFWKFFIAHLGLGLLLFVTFGLSFPYTIYWTLKYFVEHCEVEVEEKEPAKSKK